MQKKQGISLIVLVITIISMYNETTKYRKVPPKKTMQTITKIIYNKESVRNILADSLYNKICEGSIKRYNKMSNFAMKSWEKYIKNIYKQLFCMYNSCMERVI